MKNKFLFLISFLALLTNRSVWADEIDYTSKIKNPSFEGTQTLVSFQPNADAKRRFAQKGWMHVYNGADDTRQWDVARKYGKGQTGAEIANLVAAPTEGDSCFALRINQKGYENCIYQDLTDLPAGDYRLNVDVQGIAQYGTVRVTIGNRKIDGFPVVGATDKAQTIALFFHKNETETVRIGVYANNENRTGNTVILVDNFRLWKMDLLTPTYESPADVTGFLNNPSFEDGVENIRQNYYRPTGWNYTFPYAVNYDNDKYPIANVYKEGSAINSAGITSTQVKDGLYSYALRRKWYVTTMSIYQRFFPLEEGTYQIEVDVQGAPVSGFVEVQQGATSHKSAASVDKDVMERKTFMVHKRADEFLCLQVGVTPPTSSSDCQINVDNFKIKFYGLTYLNHAFDSLKTVFKDEVIPGFLRPQIEPLQSVDGLLAAINGWDETEVLITTQLDLRKPLLTLIDRVKGVMTATTALVTDQSPLTLLLADCETLYDQETTSAAQITLQQQEVEKGLMRFTESTASDIADIRINTGVSASAISGMNGSNGWAGYGRTLETGESWRADTTDTYFSPSNGSSSFTQQLTDLRPGLYSLRLAVRRPSETSGTVNVWTGKTSFTMIASKTLPFSPSTGGTVWKYAEEGSAPKMANDEKGFGWNWVVFDTITLNAGEVLKFNITGSGNISLDNDVWLYYYGGDYKKEGTTLHLRGDMQGCVSELNTLLAEGGIECVDWKSPKGSAQVTGNENSNLLVYYDQATDAKIEPGIEIINETSGEIALTDGFPLSVSTAFRAEHVRFERAFTKENSVQGTPLGWHTLVLPFTPTKITGLNKRKEIVPLAPFDPVSKTVPAGMVPFWLKELTSEGYIDVVTMEPNKPYLICMPNNAVYSTKYCIDGPVTFEADTCLIHQSDLATCAGPDYDMTGSLRGVDRSESAFVINAEGSAFVVSTDANRDVAPFEAYVAKKTTTQASVRRFALDLSSKVSTGMVELMIRDNLQQLFVYSDEGVLHIVSPDKRVVVVYTIDGRVQGRFGVDAGINRISLLKGVYMVANQKVIL